MFRLSPQGTRWTFGQPCQGSYTLFQIKVSVINYMTQRVEVLHLACEPIDAAKAGMVFIFTAVGMLMLITRRLTWPHASVIGRPVV